MPLALTTGCALCVIFGAVSECHNPWCSAYSPGDLPLIPSVWLCDPLMSTWTRSLLAFGYGNVTEGQRSAEAARPGSQNPPHPTLPNSAFSTGTLAA